MDSKLVIGVVAALLTLCVCMMLLNGKGHSRPAAVTMVPVAMPAMRTVTPAAPVMVPTMAPIMATMAPAALAAPAARTVVVPSLAPELVGYSDDETYGLV